VLDHGRVVATGSPEALKARIGGERIDVKVAALEELPAGEAALAPFADGTSSIDADALVVTVPVAAGTPLLEVVRALDGAGVAAIDVHRREATLDDVFLSLTTKVAA
jgi:ABC-2 type transport system ATP-binding protein